MENCLLLKNGSVFDTLSGTFRSGLDILVENEIVSAVARFDPGSEGCRTIDCTGKYVLPGLFECHGHLATMTTRSDELKQEIAREWGFESDDTGETLCRDILEGFVSRGITQVRDVGGPIDALKRMRDDISGGKYIGPDIFYAGPMLEKSPLTFAEHNKHLPSHTVAVDSKKDAEKIVELLKGSGAALVKTFGKFDSDVLKHLLIVAEEQNLPVTNDPGTTFFHQIPLDLGLDLGLRCFEHAKSPWYVVLKDNLRSKHDRLIGADREQKETFLDKLFDLGLESISPEKVHELGDRMRDKGVYFCLTLHAFKSLARHPEAHVKDERQIPRFKKRFETLDQVGASLAGEIAGRGVKLLAGHDGLNPDYTLEEIELMQAAGISEGEIIKGATIYPAEWLGIDDAYGSVLPGRKASILVLEKNPLENIANIRTTRLVLKNGKAVFEKEAEA